MWWFSPISTALEKWLWQDRFLFQGRRFWLSSYHLLLHVPDYLYQPESGSKKIRPGKKRRAVRYYLQPDYRRTYWNHHLHRSSGTDRRLQQRSGGSGIWRPTGKNGHSVLFSVSLFHCIAGLLRGAGKSIIPMFVMMVCWCIMRYTYITVAVRIIPSIELIFWAYPITWTLSSIVFLLFYLKSDWLHGFHPKKEK